MSRGHLLIAGALYIALDLGVAHVLRSTALWGPEAIERRYRIPHPVYHHDLAGNMALSGVWGGTPYPVRTNSLGFRDSATGAVARWSDKRRLLLIGDSFTEGLGVAFPETYAGLLQRRLAGEWEVMNAAVMSYAPSIYYRKVRYLLEDVGLRVDFVLVALDLSDITDEARGYRLDSLGNVDGQRSDPGRRLRAVLKEHSLLFHVLDLVWDASKGRLARPTEFTDWTMDSAQYAAVGEPGLALAAARMDDLRAVLRARGVGLGLAVYPYPAQVARQDSGSVQVRFWRDWAAAREVPFFNLFPAFLSSASLEEAVTALFIPHDVHWSAQGHRLVAETLLDEGLLDTIVRHAPARSRDSQ